MTFTYTIITERYGDEIDGIDFEYTPSDHNVTKEICDFVYRDYFEDIAQTKEMCEKIIRGISLLISDSDTREAFEEMYYEELKDIFREEAFNARSD